MRIDKVFIKDFKNLQDFNIDLDQKELYTVLLGQNATGKSNFIEAVIQIFKYLDIEKSHPDKKFEYEILYNCRGKNIEIYYYNRKYKFVIDGKKINSNKDFFKNKDKYLPKHIFTYYSGLSNRLYHNFIEHLKRYYISIINPQAKILDISEIRRLFYVENIHSNFVLLAFYSFPEQEKKSKEFLNKILGIVDFQSALFILKQPVWSKIKKGDVDFWGAKGIVKEFLESLWEISLAPIFNDENVEVSYKRNETQNRLYLFLSNKSKLQKLAESWTGAIPFFNAIESTFISDLVEEIRIRVKKVNAQKEITYRELSEGEQQLLTVLGLLKFTRDEESLILLDEPDTHLNPLWKWKYLEYLDMVVQKPKSTQIIINTHDPLLIGGLKKEQIRIFQTDEKNNIKTVEPDIDPRGLGVEGILTSELFGLPTTLDGPTQEMLDERNKLLVKQKESKLNKNEQVRLNELFNTLNQLGFTKTSRDPLYQKFISAIGQRKEFEVKGRQTEEQLKKQNKIALEILEEISKEGGK